MRIRDIVRHVYHTHQEKVNSPPDVDETSWSGTLTQVSSIAERCHVHHTHQAKVNSPPDVDETSWSGTLTQVSSIAERGLRMTGSARGY